MGTRKVPFSRVLYIEQDDFREDPPKQYFRLSPGREVRLRYGYFITCTGVVKNDAGEVVEIHCTYDPATRGGNAPDGRKVKSTIHWVSAEHAIDAEVRLYDNLFTKEDPNEVDEGQDFTANLNPNSLEMISACQAGAEPRRSEAGAIVISSRAWATSARIWIRRLRSRFQSHGGAAGHVGQNREKIEMIIVGLGGLYNHPACAVLVDGALAAAVEQSKIARHVQRGALPEEAIAASLQLAKVRPSDVDCVALVRPFDQNLHMAVRSEFTKARVIMVEHHEAHAASAFYPSPFEDATVLTLDRDGDFRSAARWRASHNELHLEKDLYYPDSLGDLYGRVTELLGFQAGADEHKVQWLSACEHGEAYVSLFEEILGKGDWPSIDRILVRCRPADTRRIQREILSATGFGRWSGYSGRDESSSCRGSAARHRADGFAHGRRCRAALFGRRAGSEYAVGERDRTVEKRFRAAGGGQCWDSFGSCFLRLAQRLWRNRAGLIERPLPRPELRFAKRSSRCSKIASCGFAIS